MDTQLACTILNCVGILTVDQDIGHPVSCWRESFRTSGECDNTTSGYSKPKINPL